MYSRRPRTSWRRMPLPSDEELFSLPWDWPPATGGPAPPSAAPSPPPILPESPAVPTVHSALPAPGPPQPPPDDGAADPRHPPHVAEEAPPPVEAPAQQAVPPGLGCAPWEWLHKSQVHWLLRVYHEQWAATHSSACAPAPDRSQVASSTAATREVGVQCDMEPSCRPPPAASQRPVKESQHLDGIQTTAPARSFGSHTPTLIPAQLSTSRACCRDERATSTNTQMDVMPQPGRSVSPPTHSASSTVPPTPWLPPSSPPVDTVDSESTASAAAHRSPHPADEAHAGWRPADPSAPHVIRPVMVYPSWHGPVADRMEELFRWKLSLSTPNLACWEEDDCEEDAEYPPLWEESALLPDDDGGDEEEEDEGGDTPPPESNGVLLDEATEDLLQGSGGGPQIVEEEPPAPVAPIAVVEITDEAGLRGVAAAVRQHPLVAVDCEGVNLSRVGQLTLLQMATASTVYLVDVLVLKEAAFAQGLKELLEDPSFPKVMFDCRQDSDALFHQYGVRLRGVWDLQIVDLLLRNGERGEGLSSVYYKKQGVQRIRGLEDCMRRYGGNGEMAQVKRQVHDQMRQVADIWLQRPLPPDVVQYAAADVAGLLPIDELFRKQATEAAFLQKCQEVSDRYADYFRGKARRTFDDYESNAFLPFGIVRPFEGAPTQECLGCRRHIPPDARYFEFQGGQLVSRWCFVCREVNRGFCRPLAARWATAALRYALAGATPPPSWDGALLLSAGCKHCGEDHQRSECPWREPVVCFGCGQPGHIVSKCPKRRCAEPPDPKPTPAPTPMPPLVPAP